MAELEPLQKIRLAERPPVACASLDPRVVGVQVGDGYCQCGCGYRAPIATKTCKRSGWVQGQPMRYIIGHRSTRQRPYLVDPETRCWVWQARVVGTGYGQCERQGRSVLAHRLEYEVAHGPIPEGLEIDHLCENKRCVNPAHLEPVTHAENMRRWGIRRHG